MGLLQSLRFAGFVPARARAMDGELSELSAIISMSRARVITMNAALGPLDYRVSEGMHVEPGSVVVAPWARANSSA